MFKSLFILISLFSLALLALASKISDREEDKIYLNVGDYISLYCKEMSSFNHHYTLNSKGELYFKRLGAIKVADLTEKQAAAKVLERIKQKKICSFATIVIKIVRPAMISEGYTSFQQLQPYIDSEELDYYNGTEPAQEINYCPYIDEDKYENEDWNTEMGTEPLTIDYKSLEQDQMKFSVVPNEIKEIYVLGAFKSPGAKQYFPGITLKKAIKFGKGFIARANQIIQLQRENSVIKEVNLKESFQDISLKEGDIIFAQMDDHYKYVYIKGMVHNPSGIQYDEGMTIEQLLTAAGGIKGEKIGQILLVRKIKDQEQTFKYKEDEIDQILLLPDDQIIVQAPEVSLNPNAFLGVLSLFMAGIFAR